jgi:hypothetical protein
MGDGMPMTKATRRSFISSAAAGVAVTGPLALLAGCGVGSGSTSGTSLLDMLTSQSSASAASEADVWTGAIGQAFRIGTDKGPVYASLTSVTAQAAGDRPDTLRQQPLLLSFTLDAGYDVSPDGTFFLDRTMANVSQLYMQRGTTANGRPELIALLN